MANPFYTDVNATNALVGGQTATDAFGFPSPRATAGLRAPNPRIQQAQDELRTAEAAFDARLNRRQQAPREPVLGYNPETDTLFSAGKEFDASNLSVMDAYDKAGYFDQDNSGKLPPGYIPQTPSKIRAWMQSESQNRGVGSRAAEIGKQALVGTGDIIQSGVKGLGMLAPKDSWMERSINDAVSEYDRTSEGSIPDVYGATQVGAGLTKAARSFTPSLATGAALAVNPLLGGTLLAGMGGGTVYDTYQEAIRQGLSHEDAMSAARKTGAIEAVGEGVADRLGYGILRGAGKAAAGISLPTLKHGHKVATNLLANAALQSGTEFAQAYGQRAVEQDAGISGVSPMEAGMEGFEQGAYLSALMSPLGIAAGYANRPRPAPLPPQEAPAAEPPQEEYTPLALGYSQYDEATPMGSTPAPFAPAGLLPAPQTPAVHSDNTMYVTPGGTAMPGSQLGEVGIPGESVGLPQGAQANVYGNYDTEVGTGEVARNPVLGSQPAAVDPAAQDDTSTFEMFPAEKAAATYTPEQVLSLINPLNRSWKAIKTLASDLSTAITSGNTKVQDDILSRLANTGNYKGRPLDTETVEAAHELVRMARSDVVGGLAAEGKKRAQPGVTVGQAPGTAASADTMRQQSDALLEEETAPDFARSTPNEMDPNLVKEKTGKDRLQLGRQTQADLDALNAREQWVQGPAQATGPAAIPANQLALFNRKGQPTNPAMGVPLPTSDATDQTGQASGKAPATPAKRGGTAKQAPTNKAAPTVPVEPKPTPKPAPVEPSKAESPLIAALREAEAEVRKESLPEAPAEVKERLLARLKRLDSKSITLDMRDYDKIKNDIDANDVQSATSRMAEIERDMREGRYRTVKSIGGLSRKLLDIAIQKVQKALGGKIQIEILDSVTEFDPKQTPGTRAGAYRDGKVYIFLDGVSSILDAQRTLFHELFHRGNALRHADKGYQQEMRKLYNQSAKVRAATNAWMKTDEGVKLQAQYPDADQYLAVAVDETLADTAEGLVEPGMLRTVGNWMADIADFFGMDKLAQRIRTMGQSQLEMFIRETMAYGRAVGGASGTMFRSQDITDGPAFKRWFGDSKVVDADGKPLVVYHGTAADFNAFDLGLSVEGGAFFSASPDQASRFGSSVMPVYLSVRNPLVVDGKTIPVEHELEDIEAIVSRARKGGHDGVLIRGFRDMQPTPVDTYIAFRPEQIKSATGNNGQFDPTNPDIRYRTVAETWDKTTDAATRMQGWLQSDAVGKLRRGVLSSTFLTDLVNRFADVKSLARYAEKTHLMGAAAGKYQVAATAVQNAFQSIKTTREREQLNDFMGRVTAANVSVEGDNKHLGQDQREADALKAEFAAMSDGQKVAYRKARDELRSNWKKRGELLGRETELLFKPLIDDALAAGDYKKARQLEREKDAFLKENQKVLSSLKGDYFPLMRFGRFRVVKKSDAFTKIEVERDTAFKELEALQKRMDTRSPEERKIFDANNKKRKAKGEKPLPEFTEEQQAELVDAKKKVDELESTLDTMKGNEKDYYMAQFETQAQAEADMKNVNGSYLSLVEDFHKELNPMSRNMLRRMEESLAMTLKGSGNAASVIEAKKAMMEIYLSSLPDLSAMRRQTKRRNVAGFHKDMERSIAASMLQDSFHLSRLEYMEDVKEAMLDLRREANDAARSGEGIQLQELANEIERRFAADQRRVDTPVQDFLSGMGWFYNLALSPMYVITNLLQPFMISLPMMASRHKFYRTSQYMKTAWADTARLIPPSFAKNWKGDIDFEGSSLPADEKAMLRQMLESQLLTVSLVSDLSSTADGKGVSKFTQLTALPAHHAEVINRIGTALAAYRLEKDTTGDVDRATKYAAKLLDQTHFNYSTENAPYWMKPGVVPMGKVAFQFRKYTVGMLSLYARTVAAGIQKLDPEARSEAVRFALFHLVALQAMAGATGLPIALPLKLLAGMFMDDEDGDPEVALRNALTDIMGKTAATAFMKGLPAVGDMDLSTRVGTGNLLNPVPYMRDADNMRGQYQEFLLSLTGPTLGGVIPNFADGAQHAAEGNFVRAAESFLPKFARDVVKSGRFAAEGVTTRSGDTMRGQSDGWEAFLTAAGLTPTDINDAYKANAAIQETRSWYMDQRKELTREWLEADSKAEAMKAVREYNAKAAAANMKPLTLADLQRAKVLKERRNESYAKYGSNLPKSEVGLADEGRFLEKTEAE